MRTDPRRTGAYESFDKFTASIEAFCIIKDGQAVGRVVFRHLSQCTCYAQIWGLEMQKGWARGNGYDRASGAFEAAASRIHLGDNKDRTTDPKWRVHLEAWHKAAKGPEGIRWKQRLEDAGYTVAGGHIAMNYQQAKARKAELEAAQHEASRALSAISGGGPMGLTPDHVKTTPEWQARRVSWDRAWTALRAFNGWYVKTFAAEIKAERRAR